MTLAGIWQCGRQTDMDQDRNKDIPRTGWRQLAGVACMAKPHGTLAGRQMFQPFYASLTSHLP